MTLAIAEKMVKEINGSMKAMLEMEGKERSYEAGYVQGIIRVLKACGYDVVRNDRTYSIK